MLFTLTAPAPVGASFIPAGTPGSNSRDERPVEALRAGLERTWISERLALLGLSGEEIRERLGALSDEQCQDLAADLDRIQVGGEAQEKEGGGETFWGTTRDVLVFTLVLVAGIWLIDAAVGAFTP